MLERSRLLIRRRSAASVSSLPGLAWDTADFSTRSVSSYTFSGTGYGCPSFPPCASEKRAGSGKAAFERSVDHLFGDKRQ